MRTRAREATVLAMTCGFLGVVGVGKVTLVGAGASGEDGSDPDSSR